ncbi:MAG: hypothetical protein ACI83P_002372 [Janthinobacterium sp.]|jgi:hypothetical protein
MNKATSIKTAAVADSNQKTLFPTAAGMQKAAADKAAAAVKTTAAAKATATAKAPPAAKPAATVKTAAAKPAGTVKTAAAKPAGTVKTAAAKPAGTVKTAAAKPAGTVKTAAAAKTVTTKPVAAKTAAAKPAAAAVDLDARDKARKSKLVRDSFTMPEQEYAVLGQVKKACLKAGFDIKKSELLRIGVALINQIDLVTLKTVLVALPQLKTGRPKKS